MIVGQYVLLKSPQVVGKVVGKVVGLCGEELVVKLLSDASWHGTTIYTKGATLYRYPEEVHETLSGTEDQIRALDSILNLDSK